MTCSQVNWSTVFSSGFVDIVTRKCSDVVVIFSSELCTWSRWKPPSSRMSTAATSLNLDVFAYFFLINGLSPSQSKPWLCWAMRSDIAEWPIVFCCGLFSFFCSGKSSRGYSLPGWGIPTGWWYTGMLTGFRVSVPDLMHQFAKLSAFWKFGQNNTQFVPNRVFFAAIWYSDGS